MVEASINARSLSHREAVIILSQIVAAMAIDGQSNSGGEEGVFGSFAKDCVAEVVDLLVRNAIHRIPKEEFICYQEILLNCYDDLCSQGHEGCKDAGEQIISMMMSRARSLADPDNSALLFGNF